jgi:hypothetical protein
MKGEKARPQPRGSRAQIFRAAIESAEAEGFGRSDLVLHLTLSDTHKLKTDQEIPLADVSFVGGVMSFMGVAVVQGGVMVSSLSAEGRAKVAFAA